MTRCRREIVSLQWMTRAARASLAALISVVTLSACTAFQARPLSAEHGLDSFDARRLDDPELRHFMEGRLHEPVSPWPPPSWDFARLVLAADHYQADLAVAQAKLRAAQAAIVTAGARPNPSLAFSPSYETSVAPGISPWTLGFTLDIPIETAGKRGYRIAQARHLANAATLELAMASWQVRSRVRGSLVRLEAAEQAQDILNRALAAQSQAVQLLEQRLNVGQASVTEVELMRVTADQTALQLRDAQTQRAQALLALAGAIGVPEAALIGTRLSFAELDVLPAPEQAMPSRRDALLNRSDVLAALSQYQASESALQLQIARQYPDVHLGPGFSHGPVANEVETQIAFGISLPLPIFQHNQGPIAEAQAQREEAAAHFNTVQAQAVGQADGALSGYRDSLAKLKTAEQLRDDSQRRLSSVQALFDRGVANRLSLVQAQGELATNELARAQAFTESQLALGQLEDAMQRPAEVAHANPAAALAGRGRSLGAPP